MKTDQSNDNSLVGTPRFLSVGSVLLLALALLVGTSACGQAQKPQAVPDKEAATVPATPTLTEVEKTELAKLRQQASKLLADVAIARIALLHDMQPDADLHLHNAVQGARQLESMTTKFNSGEPIKFGKLTYKSGEKKHDFWLPIANDTFVISSLEEQTLGKKRPDIQIADAQAVGHFVVLDTTMLREKVEAAEKSFKEKNYGHAALLLNEANDSALSEDAIVPLPLETVRENLVLARELCRDKNYGSARIALGYAEETLSQAQREFSDASDQQKLKHLQSQISAVRADLAKKDPCVLQRVEQKVGSWIHDIEGLLVQGNQKTVK